jgi:AraC-like DNA-binding protein
MHIVPVSRAPAIALAPWVERLWLSRSPETPRCAREIVLPTGLTHLVWRLHGPPLEIFGPEGDSSNAVYREAVLGGPRTGFYRKAVGAQVVSVGVQLRPGAVQALFGISTGELAGRHTPLSELCGASAADITDQLHATDNPAQLLDTLERWLAHRLRGARTLAPAVEGALQELQPGMRVGDSVLRSGYSHRSFITQFRNATGFSPKSYTRVTRLVRALALLARSDSMGLAELAATVGYSDQAHMTREFQVLAGVTPGTYRRLAPPMRHHVPDVMASGQFCSRSTRPSSLESTHHHSRRRPDDP